MIIFAKYHYNKHNDFIISINITDECKEKYKLYTSNLFITKSKNKFSDEDINDKINIGSPKIILYNNYYKLLIPFIIKRYHKFSYDIYDNEIKHSTYPQSDRHYYIDDYGIKENEYYIFESHNII